MSTGSTAARDARRHRENERSLQWARKVHEAWTDDDDMIILEQWVLAVPADRDEAGIARQLERTIFGCQRRAEELRAKLDASGQSPPKRQPEPQYIGKDDDDEDQWWSPTYYTNTNNPAQPNQ